MYRVLLSDSARKFYERADRPLQQKLDRCIEQLRAEPRTHPNIKRLKGQIGAYYRYRIGDYRVVYRMEEKGERLVIVVVIAHRSEVYR